MVNIRWLGAERSKCKKLKTFEIVPSVNLFFNFHPKVHLASKSKKLPWSGSPIGIVPWSIPREAILLRITLVVTVNRIHEKIFHSTHSFKKQAFKAISFLHLFSYFKNWHPFGKNKRYANITTLGRLQDTFPTWTTWWWLRVPSVDEPSLQLQAQLFWGKAESATDLENIYLQTSGFCWFF